MAMAMAMDKEHVKGAVNKTKDTIGRRMTGNTKMQAEGKVDKAKGGCTSGRGLVRLRRAVFPLKYDELARPRTAG
jgi:uncharacterized protein YjbJ (UPF0337 family)